MALSDEQFDRLTEILEAARDSMQRLNDWETKFIEDMQAKYDEHGQDTFVSAKQWTALERIMEKL